ncbi:DUF4037 domain-containing protein [Devosia sp. MC1541]|uniref:DUF4037 domain-containing protein n=1 Tax=Devosia sp. MC1541 TaxID=2725264 RepID=UPI00145D202E|nr:DUF4037 domain-containing protein [Devosia sp. MC1541]
MSLRDELIAVMVPLIADLAEDGAAAVALAGSHGKGRADALSDYDFRAYSDAYRPHLQQTPQWQRFLLEQRRFQKLGARMDGIWMRSYQGVRRDLNGWLAGQVVEKQFEWTIWGYQLPTDLSTQLIAYDPRGELQSWRMELAVFPEILRSAIFTHYRKILDYWKSDYHYTSKVIRLDLVFLAGITGKLVNAIMQVVFAFNRRYFPGDGWNLVLAHELPQLPPHFVERMVEIVEPGNAPDRWHRQRENIVSMINDVETLISAEVGRKLPSAVVELRPEARGDLS